MKESGVGQSHGNMGRAVFLFALGYVRKEREDAMIQTSPHRHQAIAGAALMLAAGALFAVVNTLVQIVTMQMGEGSTSVAFWQYFIAMLFMLPWIAVRARHAMGTGRIGVHILRVLLAAAGVQLWVMGLAHVPIWQAIALIMTSPFFVTLGAGMFLGESISAQRVAAVIGGFAGGMIVLAPWSDAFSMHAMLPVAAAFLWAMSSLVTKHLTATESSETLTFYLLVLLTPINAVLAMGDGFVLQTSTAFAAVALAGVVTAGAQYVLVKAYSVADAAYLQPFDHLKLPLNVALGWAVFGFLPGGNTWLGAALIVGASFYLLNSETRAQNRLARAA